MEKTYGDGSQLLIHLYTAMTALYGLFCLLVSFQLFRIVRIVLLNKRSSTPSAGVFEVKLRSLLFQHTGLLVVGVCRLLGCATDLRSIGAQLFSFPFPVIDVLFAVQYSLTMAIFSSTIIQWAAVIHSSDNGEDSRGSRKRRQIFILINVLINLVVISLLGLVIGKENNDHGGVFIAFAFSFFAFCTLCIGITFFLYGFLIIRQLGKGTAVVHHLCCRTISGRLGYGVFVISISFVTQSFFLMLTYHLPAHPMLPFVSSLSAFLAILGILLAFWRAVGKLLIEFKDNLETNMTLDRPGPASFPMQKLEDEIDGAYPTATTERTMTSSHRGGAKDSSEQQGGRPAGRLSQWDIQPSSMDLVEIDLNTEATEAFDEGQLYIS